MSIERKIEVMKPAKSMRSASIGSAPGDNGSPQKPHVGIQILALALVTLCCFTFIKNFWLNEDAFIIYRSLDQLMAGNGPVWNTGERVQVYTSVAWYWLLAALQWPLGNVFISTGVLSGALLGAALLGAWRSFKASPALLFLLACWLLSKSWFDYTSSGLENILGYAVIVFWYDAYRQCARQDRQQRAQWQLIACSALLPLVRHDSLLLVLPALLGYAWQIRLDRKSLLQLCTAALPLLLWTAFSLLYYGAPLPNTAYAKLNHGFPQVQMWAAGWRYLSAHIAADPITPLIISGALLACLQYRKRLLGIGIVLQLIYIAYAGGDYMMGRFICFAFLLASLILADTLQQQWASKTLLSAIGAGLLIYATIVPRLPILTPFDYGKHMPQRMLIDEALQTGILDARAMHYTASLDAWRKNEFLKEGLFGYFRADGEMLKNKGERVVVRGALGCTGYYAGLAPHIVDPYALTDPFLARLPAIRRYVIGHYEREMVAGYVEHLRDPHIALTDAKLARFYSQIELITHGDALFMLPRLQAIVAVNDGASAKLLSAYRRQILARQEQPGPTP
ncbi:MAG TPA: hypothetical protein VLC91_01245 [Spongiibacteraceae bacterium]|nr:hypothetical protein [Spongiibacteraceae bacterium]